MYTSLRIDEARTNMANHVRFTVSKVKHLQIHENTEIEGAKVDSKY